MSIKIQKLELGPLANNTFVLMNPQTSTAIIVDPSLGADVVLEPLHELGMKITSILLTHAHFDHIAGASAISNSRIPNIPVHLHAEDLPLWQRGGDSAEFGYMIELPDNVRSDLEDGQVICMGEDEIQVRYTPGHSRGHVIFYIPSAGTALVGDLIFREGVGRTDLPGGDARTLIHSIRSQVLTLPDETVLIPGHGPSTTVAYEKAHNPFVA